MDTVTAQLTEAIGARYPLIYVQTPEEDRVLAGLTETLKVRMPDGKLVTWSSVDGLQPGGDAETVDPVTAIQTLLKKPQPGFYVMKNLDAFLDRPDVVRALRNAYYALAEKGETFIVLVSPVNALPESLAKEVFLLNLPLPTPQELSEGVAAVGAVYPGVDVPEELHDKIGLALRGLTLKEAEHVLHGALSGGEVTRENLLKRIFSEKEKAVRKFGVLEYVRTTDKLRDIGGMEILREWILKRKPLFTQAAVEAGQPVPRGVLIMGISGCGKSLCAKVVANLWDVPLFRLDMNMVFSGLYGNPHAAFQRALTGIESVAPAVLWIDEIENGLGMTSTVSSSEQTLTFSSFLTWMQERPPLIFVAATANRIESLPAEVIRKGRFDEVFFCDLPTDEERKEIIRIHLERSEIDPEKVDPGKLLYTTRGWSGAEIEQAIVATRIEALHEGREADLDDVKVQMRGMVPLSTTMSEQIRSIREWSHHRARRASKAPPKTMVPE